MRLYIHREGRHDADALETEATVPIAKTLGIDGDTLVIVEDAEDPLDASMTFESAGVKDRDHIFVGKRRRIEVVVSFNGERRERKFGPAQRVQRVFRWATGKQGFDLGDEDAAEHTLALADIGVTPPGDTHLGSLDDRTPGHVAFTLIPKHRYEG